VVEVTDATQAFSEDNVKLDNDTALQPSVRNYYIDLGFWDYYSGIYPSRPGVIRNYNDSSESLRTTVF
jgi:hypothetical protein